MHDENVAILTIALSDVTELAQLHRRAFPEFFLSQLGNRFLREFYRSFVGDKNALTCVAREGTGGKLLGAVVGTTSPSSFFRQLAARRWWAFGLASLGAILKNPRVLKRLFRARQYRGDEPGRPGYALLSSIAVDPETQGRGVGAMLLRSWAKEARARGCAGAYLTTDALGNDRVNRFYQREGWTVESTYATPEGRKMNRYVLSFPDGLK